MIFFFVKTQTRQELWMKCLCIFIIGLQPVCCIAQSPTAIKFNHFSAAHGLSQSYFPSILQDKKGYMWFASSNGLVKYDGYTLTSFQTDPNSKNSILTNNTNHLCEDGKENIWIACDNGLSRYNTHTGNFTSYINNAKNGYSLLSNNVSCLLSDKQGKVWIGTDAGLCFYESATDKFINLLQIISPDTLCNVRIKCLMIDHNGMLWIGTERGINIFDPVHKKLACLTPKDGLYSMGGEEISYMLEDHSGAIWISLWNKGIYRYNPSNNSSKIYRHNTARSNSLSSDAVNVLTEDSHHNIWAGMYGGGISIYLPETDDFKTYKTDLKNVYSLTTNHILDLYEDRSGCMWIGTNGGGLANSCPSNERFTIYQNYDSDFSSHYPLSVYKDHEGQIFITTFGGGVKEFDKTTGNFKTYQVVLSNDAISSANFSYGALEASDGNFWLVNFDEGLYKLNRTTGKFTTIHSTHNSNDKSIHNQFNCIAEDHNKRLWIGTSAGLKCYDLKTKTFSVFEDIYRDTNQLSSDAILSMYMDKMGVLWIAGSHSGLTLLNTVSGGIKIFKHDDLNKNSISPGNICSFYDDGNGRVWIGTDGAGLNRYDKKSGEFTSYTKREGLPDNTVRGILADNHGNLWLSSNSGICKFIPPSKGNNRVVCRNYNMSDGLPGDEFYYNTCVKGDDGTFYFGSNAGLIAFNPEELPDNTYAPSAIITDFSIFNRSVSLNDSTQILKLPIDETKEIRISYAQNNFSFAFSAPDYVDPDKNKFAYKLEHFDKDWIQTDAKKRYASYTNLDAGEYVFRVKASNCDDVWNEQGQFIKLIIAPPYWKTWWFKLLCTIGVGVILYIVYYNRMQKLRDINRIRNKIASDLHDDLGATLSSISIMSELVNQQVKEQSPQVSSLLEKIGSSSRNMIESVNDMVWAINPKNDSFENIIKRMRNFASEILIPKDIAFHFDFDRNLLHSRLKMDMRRSFYLIFKEAVNNVAKYSNAANAFVMIWYQENNLKMTIRDDGDGFDPDIADQGNGLTNMQQRAEGMNAHFHLQSVPGKGTLVELEFKNC